MKTVVTKALIREQVDIRGGDPGAVTPELGKTQVVKEDHDDVRSIHGFPNDEAARKRGFRALLPVWGSFYKDSSGCVVVVVVEPVSDASYEASPS